MKIVNDITRHSIRKWAKPKRISNKRRSISGYDIERIAVILSFERVEYNGRKIDRVNIETDAGFVTWRLYYNICRIDIPS